MAKRRRKSRGCSTLVLLLAALFAILTVCGFMVMVWGMILSDQDGYQPGNCHLSITSFDSIARATPSPNEPEVTANPDWSVTPGDRWTRHATP